MKWFVYVEQKVERNNFRSARGKTLPSLHHAISFNLNLNLNSWWIMTKSCAAIWIEWWHGPKNWWNKFVPRSNDILKMKYCQWFYDYWKSFKIFTKMRVEQFWKSILLKDAIMVILWMCNLGRVFTSYGELDSKWRIWHDGVMADVFHKPIWNCSILFLVPYYIIIEIYIVLSMILEHIP
jgi:hypothetical protein